MLPFSFVSTADMGSLFRDGLGGNASPEILQQMLGASAKARIAEANGEAPEYMNIVPDSPADVTPDSPADVTPDSPADVTPDTPRLYREGTDYYRTPRAQHPNSVNKCLMRSVDRIAHIRPMIW